MAIVKSGEYHDPNKHEALRLTDKDRRIISQFSHELVSPLRPEVTDAEDDAHIIEVEFQAAVHELGDQPNMQAVRVLELATSGALSNLEDAKRLFESATETMDKNQREVLESVWASTVDARTRLPHAQSELEVESTYTNLSRLSDQYALKNSDDKRLGTYLAAFAAGMTRKSQYGPMHAEQLEAHLERR